MIKNLIKLFKFRVVPDTVETLPDQAPPAEATELEKFIMKHEGLRLVAYLDPAGVPTIGWGHTKTVTREQVGVRRITKVEALELLRADIEPAKWAARAITGLTGGPKFNGVVSFVFNLGPGALHGQTTQIGRHLLAKDYASAAEGMQRYVYGGGRRLPGLVTRRREEGNLVNK